MSLFTLFFFPLLISLGLWQLSRADEKQARYELAEARKQQAPQRLSELSGVAAERNGFQRVRAVGRFDAARHLLLDNQHAGGQVGYWVLQPFATTDETWLVNRGFIAAAARREQWPPVITPAGELEIEAVLWPQFGLLPLLDSEGSVESAPGSATGWPKRVQRLDFAAFQRLFGELAPMEVRLLPGSAGAMPEVAPTEQPNGAARHQGYAVQWFGLAIVLIAGFVIFGVLGAREKNAQAAK